MVDLLDQMVGYYLINHRSVQWWRKLFFHLMSAMAYNTYIVAHDSNPDIAKSNDPVSKITWNSFVWASLVTPEFNGMHHM